MKGPKIAHWAVKKLMFAIWRQICKFLRQNLEKNREKGPFLAPIMRNFGWQAWINVKKLMFAIWRQICKFLRQNLEKNREKGHF